MMGQDNSSAESAFLQALVPEGHQPKRSYVRLLRSAHSPSREDTAR